jgi:hypothetical protein
VKDLLDYIRFNEHHFPVSAELAQSYMHRVSTGYDQMQRRSIVIAGLARNVSSILPATMLRMELLGRTFSDYRILIYENDSIDRTVDILAAWSRANPRVEIVTESFGAPPSRPVRCLNRADRMAFYRGRCQARIRERYADTDYVALIDTDVAGGWSPDGVASTFGHDGWDFVGSNGLIYKRKGWDANATAHYDAWAFRTDEAFSPLTTKYVNHLEFTRGQPLVPLPSCFGGLGFYRMEAYLAGTYEGGDIEHVSMHRSMREQGYDKMFLNPSQIVVYGRKHRRWDRWVKRTQLVAHALSLRRFRQWRFEEPMDFGQHEPHFQTGCLAHLDQQLEPTAA